MTCNQGLPHRPYSKDPRHRNTFVWTFEYFTIVGDERYVEKAVFPAWALKIDFILVNR